MLFCFFSLLLAYVEGEDGDCGAILARKSRVLRVCVCVCVCVCVRARLVVHVFVSLPQDKGSSNILLGSAFFHPSSLDQCSCFGARLVFASIVAFVRRVLTSALQRMTLQFAFVKPLVAVLSLCLEPFGLLGDGAFRVNQAFLYFTIVTNASVFFAMYFLVLFYLAAKGPLHKFSYVMCLWLFL